jgi:hypothetical protein
MYHWLYDHFGWPGSFRVSLLFGPALKAADGWQTEIGELG